MRTSITHNQARQLLCNKFVVVLGDSVQRAIYKDLVLLLQRDQHLTLSQLKNKGEFSFEQDLLIEGGRLGEMCNGTGYKEVRQYRSDNHLLRFYFLTRIFSAYMKSVLEDFRRGIKPDVIIVSSCLWDISRYGAGRLEEYKENLHQFFSQVKNIVPPDCLIVWNMAMPLGKKIKGGFLVPEVSHLAPSLRYDVIEANFYNCLTAEEYNLDVLDLHFHFRLSLQHRMPDGVHWDALAHRQISSLLLTHIADAWGVDLHEPPQVPPQTCRPTQYDQSQFWSDKPELASINSDYQYQGQLLHQPDHLNRGWASALNKWLSADGQRDRPLQVMERDREREQQRRGRDYGSQREDCCMRRRRRSNRAQPYPSHQPPHVTSRHPTYRW